MSQTDHAPALLGATVNEVVNDRPEALRVFRAYGIDACCGGALTVGEAARRHGIDVTALLEALRPGSGEPAA